MAKLPKLAPSSGTTKNRVLLTGLLLFLLLEQVLANRPPRFLIDGQPEIVLRLKEGPETPIGSAIYHLRGVDPDGDPLTFGIRAQPGAEVLKIVALNTNEASIVLAEELDRETRDEYAIVLTLTDGKLGANYITQSLLLLVEDVNDNVPVFESYQSTVVVKEDARPGVIASLEAKDADEGAYGQVVYRLEDESGLFGVGTTGGRAVVRLVGGLDYERQTLHQLRVLAVDRAKGGRVNTGTASVLVKVEDVEDQPPEFVRVQAVARVEENCAVGTEVLQVRAIDGDRGINNPITYTLTPTTPYFTIHPTTGTITTAAPIDREAHPTSATHLLRITATEATSALIPRPSAATEATVVITDLNDNAPRFRSALYRCQIAENSPTNTPLLLLDDQPAEVYDHDQGINGTFGLYLKGASSAAFDVTPTTRAINEATFMLKVRNASMLDYEMVKGFNFTLVAKEVGDMPKFSEVQVQVEVLDRNDNYPEFLQAIYEVEIPENSPEGTTIARIQATDADTGDFGTAGIRYTRLAGSVAHLLRLHPATGVVTIRTGGGPSWDREVVARHHLTAEARDDRARGNRNAVQLVVALADANDNAPAFAQRRYEARLRENAARFEEAVRAEARDDDLNGTLNSRVAYSLVGEFAANFTIDADSGRVRPRRPVDFEALPLTTNADVFAMRFIVRATDLGTPPLFTEVPFYVYVQDVNDHAPSFAQLFYNHSVLETAPGGTPLLTVAATDSDGSSPNNRVVYRIQSGASDKFVIGAETGVITVARGASLDPDLTNPRTTRYELRVLALDGGSEQLQAAATVHLTVADVNNKSPVFTPPAPALLAESAPVGSLVARLSATDPDLSARLQFALASCEGRNEHGALLPAAAFDCPAHFALDAASGELRLARPLDRELVETVAFEVGVEDAAAEGGRQRAAGRLLLTVGDVNDNAPRFGAAAYRFQVMENARGGAPIGAVAATDADRDQAVGYELDAPPAVRELVRVDAGSGELVVAGRIDHEAGAWLNFTVRASDGGAPPMTGCVEVFVQVLDENDNSPWFVAEPQAALVAEDAPVGASVAAVEARDADAGEFGRVTYLLDRASSGGRFSLEADSGVVRVAGKLDREERDNYLLVIEAWDNYQFGFNSGESRNAFKHLNVTLLDVNDNPPQLLVPAACIDITEFHEPGQTIATFHATDADDPATANGQVIIDLSDGNRAGYFALEQTGEWTAALRSVVSLRGRQGNYSLRVRAQDLGTPSHLVEAPVDVCVSDFNDHAPVFVTPPHNSTLRVPENATVGSALIQIQATDADTGPNGELRYRLKPDPSGHFRAFHLHPASGILELRLPLDRRRRKVHDIRIEAYDLGEPSLAADLDLAVYAASVDDYRPLFAAPRFRANFTENRRARALPLPPTVERDERELDGPPAPVCYFVLRGDPGGAFALDAERHTLEPTRALDRETVEVYHLLVKATESCHLRPANQSYSEVAHDETLLNVTIRVLDVNDNAPKFDHRVFTGGVSTANAFGTAFMTIHATDADLDPNITYQMVGRVQMTLTEGLDSLQRDPFVVDAATGEIRLNFDPQQGMKGYFDFMVQANDTRHQDMARVFIYLLREDQRVRFVLRQRPDEIRTRIEQFRAILGNVSGAIVNVDEFRLHSNRDGTVDKTRSDLYLHLVDRRDNSIIEVDEVLRLVDQNTERLDGLFKAFNVLDTQPGGAVALARAAGGGAGFWLGAAALLLGALLAVCLALCVSQRLAYERRLRAATATAFDEAEAKGGAGAGRVPNTNKHSVEGSNPIWLQAYENEWYKNADRFSNQSEHDSLDENVIQCGEDVLEEGQQTAQNVYQTLPPALPRRKLETTEL